MKKNLLTLAVLGASVALLAGCSLTTPTDVEEDTGVVVEETTTVETPTVTTWDETPAVDEATTEDTTEATAE